MQTYDIAKRFHIITGGPGSGKSSVIDALAEEGVSHMPEAGAPLFKTKLRLADVVAP